MRAKNLRRLVGILLLTVILWGGAFAATSNARSDVKRANAAKPAETRQDLPGYFNLGLDLQGGISVVLAPKAGEPTEALDQAIEIIRNRVDALGVAEPEISRQGNNILVQLPGLKDQARALEAIGTTARLRFRPVLASLGSTAQPVGQIPEGVEVPTCGDRATYPEDDPKGTLVYCSRPPEDKDGNTATPDQWDRLALGPVELQGEDVSTATAQLDETAAWVVSLKLTGDGGKKFTAITKRLAGKPAGSPERQLAIVLDKEVVSHPQIGETVDPQIGISGGTAVISGGFLEKEANELALVLKYGSLPVDLEPSTTTTISPTLGKDSLKSGLLAGLIGLGIVFVYVCLFYRMLSPVIWVGLAIHAAITSAVVSLLGTYVGFALSLAGIAGLIVSLGVAADSFIVYFERLKDEVAAGRSVKAAVDRAWASSRRTILAADTVTALAAVTLYFLAVGNVRGFALMLGIATALDIIVSYIFMHPVIWLLAQTRFLAKSKTLGARRALAEGARA